MNSSDSNVVPVDQDKMRLIRSLACIGITDEMINEAANYTYDWATEHQEMGDFRVLLKIAMTHVLLGGVKPSGYRSN